MTENNRYHFLDSSRGIAALIVLLAHTIKTFSPEFFKSTFHFVWDSEAAVLYFFILSGFVLTESIQSEKLSPTSYINFIGKRICRIYPAFIIVLIFSFLLYSFFSDPVNGWLNDYWRNQPNVLDLIKQSILIKRIPNDPTLRILPHDWTLSIEMLISCTLPFLVWIAKRNSWLVLLIVYAAVQFLPIDKFIFDFTIGVFISTQKENLKSVWKKMNILGHSLTIIGAFFLIQITSIWPENSSLFEMVFIHLKTIGLAFLLIALISSDKLQKLLTNKFLNLQGKISYSLYLVHFIIVGILFQRHPELHLFSALILVYLLSFTISFLLYFQIEKPWIQVGKKWFSGIKGQ